MFSKSSVSQGWGKLLGILHHLLNLHSTGALISYTFLMVHYLYYSRKLLCKLYCINILIFKWPARADMYCIRKRQLMGDPKNEHLCKNRTCIGRENFRYSVLHIYTYIRIRFLGVLLKPSLVHQIGPSPGVIILVAYQYKNIF
jgi:hypothetical protein